MDKSKSNTPPPRKRVRKTLSCAPCRKRKIKCDHKQPCGQCILRGFKDQCQYEISNRWGYSNDPHESPEQPPPSSASSSAPTTTTLPSISCDSIPNVKFINTFSSTSSLSSSSSSSSSVIIPSIESGSTSISPTESIPRNGGLSSTSTSASTPSTASSSSSASSNTREVLMYPQTGLPTDYNFKYSQPLQFPKENRKYTILDSNNRSLPYPVKLSSNSQLPSNLIEVTNSPISQQDGEFLINETRRLCSFLPVMNWDKIHQTFQDWNKLDITPPGSNCELLSMLMVISIGCKISSHNNIANPIFFQQWIDNLIGEASKELYYYYPPSFYGMNDITAYLLSASYLCYDDTDHVGISWTKMTMITASLQRLGYRFNVDDEPDKTNERWLRYFKGTEKLIAFSMRTESLLNSKLFPHILESSASDGTFPSIRLSLFETIDNILENIYSVRHLVHPRNLSKYENLVRKIGADFVDSFSPQQLQDPKIKYQVLTIQSLCNSVILLIYRPYIITNSDPTVETEIFRRKGTSAAIGTIETMLQFLEGDPATFKIYKWFSWVDILMGAFEACVLLVLDHNTRKKLAISPDQSYMIQRFAIRLFQSQDPSTRSSGNSAKNNGSTGQAGSQQQNNGLFNQPTDIPSIESVCWNCTDFNWRVNLVEKCRIHFMRLSTGELSRPAKASTILTAMLGNMKVTQVPKLFGPFTKALEGSSRYIIAQYDESFFARVGSERSIEFNQRIGLAINDTMTF